MWNRAHHHTAPWFWIRSEPHHMQIVLQAGFGIRNSRQQTTTRNHQAWCAPNRPIMIDNGHALNIDGKSRLENPRSQRGHGQLMPLLTKNDGWNYVYYLLETKNTRMVWDSDRLLPLMFSTLVSCWDTASVSVPSINPTECVLYERIHTPLYLFSCVLQ